MNVLNRRRAMSMWTPVLLLVLLLPQVATAQAGGKITSLTPCDGQANPVPAGAHVTFTAVASFGVDDGKKDKHEITLSIKVVDKDGKVVCHSEKSITLTTGMGYVGFPTSCDDANLSAGAYKVQSKLTDLVNDTAPEIELDKKECPFTKK